MKYDLRQYELAIKDYDKAIEINPKYVEAYNNRGTAKCLLGQFESAIKDYNSSLALNPNDELAKNCKAIALEAMQGKKDNSSIYVWISIGLFAISVLGYFLYRLKRK